MTRSTLVCAIVTIVALLANPALQGATTGRERQVERFFLMGSGRLSLHNLRNNQHATVSLLNPDGTLNEAAMLAADRVFGFPSREMGEHISPRLLFMLSYFSDLAAPGKTIEIESGYRSLEYNNAIRSKGANAARTSTHIDGMALDFWIDGVDGKQLWETIRAKHCCGAGHYGGKTIHLDAGRPRFWEAATSGTRTSEPDYNRHVYLASMYDRYLPGEDIRFALSGISTFGFGVQPVVTLMRAGSTKPWTTMHLQHPEKTACLTLPDQKAAHFLTATLPAALPTGRYTAQLTFCRRPFAQMPKHLVSNEFELINPGGAYSSPSR